MKSVVDKKSLMKLSGLEQIPQVSARRMAVRVKPQAERTIRQGHPWLFESSIVQQSHDGNTGDLAVIFDSKRRFLAIGLYDPESVIRVRILHHGQPTTIDQDWFAQKIEHTLQKRSLLAESARFPQQATTGYRLIHGENDGLPGLVLDRYARTLVAKVYTASWLPHLDTVLQCVLAVQPANRIVLRLGRTIQQQAKLYNVTDGMDLLGAASAEATIFCENGLWFEVDPQHGQKTGFFLDQRDNRTRVEKLSAGKHVLNVFAYSGGFSLYSARGGARSVTSLDISQPALDAAERNFALNQKVASIAATPHATLKADAFRGLAELKQAGKRYELVVIDPPAFAKQQSEIGNALSAYTRLTELGLGVLRSGGTIVLASCSSRIASESFYRTVHQAAERAGRALNEFDRNAHALDHPIGFPEGAYLKCLFATA